MVWTLLDIEESGGDCVFSSGGLPGKVMRSVGENALEWGIGMTHP